MKNIFTDYFLIKMCQKYQQSFNVTVSSSKNKQKNRSNDITWLKLDLNPQPLRQILDHFAKLSK